MIRLFVILAFLFSVAAHASGPAEGTLDDQLLAADWPGAKKFHEDVLGSKASPCPTYMQYEKKYADVEIVLIRIMSLVQIAKCENQVEIAKKYLDHKDSFVRAAAIDLGATFTAEDKKRIEKQIKKLSASFDPPIREAVQKYYKKR